MKKETNTTLLFKKFRASWRKAFLKLIPLGRFSTQNFIQIFHKGDKAFHVIFRRLQKAKKSIYIETYILAADKVGLKLRDLLMEAKKRGVSITVLYDHFGSKNLNSRYLEPMAQAGIRILAFNPIWPWRRRGPLLFRDHRKIIVIDEEVAFCGSINLSKDYAGPIYGTDRFRDSLALVIGPAVKDLLSITLESIAESEFEKNPKKLTQSLKGMKKPLALKLFFQRLFSKKEVLKMQQKSKGALVQVLPSNMRRNLTHIQKSMEESVNRAVHYCYFTTPYFLPYQGLRKAMIEAKTRGVDVRILTAGMSDVPLMRYASRHIYTDFLKNGIRIYEMNQKTLHAKISTIDGIYASLGSYNLDHWSARRNLEVNLSIIDQNIALSLKEQFENDLKLSSEIHKVEFLNRSKMRRFLCWLAYSVMRL